MVSIDALLGIYILNEHNLNNLLHFSIVHIIFLHRKADFLDDFYTAIDLYCPWFTNFV